MRILSLVYASYIAKGAAEQAVHAAMLTSNPLVCSDIKAARRAVACEQYSGSFSLTTHNAMRVGADAALVRLVNCRSRRITEQ